MVREIRFLPNAERGREAPISRLKLPEALFSNGWGFWIPLFVVYCLGLALNFPTSWVWIAFDLIHVGLFLGLAYFFYKARPNCVFWVILLLVFLVPGAYLEYPSDPWEHYLRIFSWLKADHVQEGEYAKKFGYAWAYSLVRHFPLEYRRLGLDLYSSLTQWLFAFQLYLLCCRLGLEKNWSRLCSIATIVLFGTNAFTFRYYALAATMPSYIAYLAALNLCLAKEKALKLRVFGIAFLLLFMVFNHAQEFFFCLFVAPVLIACLAWQAGDANRRKQIERGVYAVVGGSFVFGLLTYFLDGSVYSNVGYSTAWGGLQFWRANARVLETLGVHGIVSLGLAIYYFRKYLIFASLTLMPFAATQCAPLLYPMYKLSIVNFAGDNYRLLYAFPTAIMLVVVLRDILVGRKHSLFIGAAIVIVISLPPQYPWRGRGYFAFHKPDPLRALIPLDETVAWFSANRSYARDCYLVADDPTTFTLNANLGGNFRARSRYHWNFRIDPTLTTQKVEDLQGLHSLLAAWKVCAVLVTLQDKIPGETASPMGVISGHWDPRLVDFHWINSPQFEVAVRSLLNEGWKATPVPPYYLLYEPR